jgi:hypothetical protein
VKVEKAARFEAISDNQGWEIKMLRAEIGTLEKMNSALLRIFLCFEGIEKKMLIDQAIGRGVVIHTSPPIDTGLPPSQSKPLAVSQAVSLK